MTAWMLYALLAGVLFSAAGLIAERIVLAARVPLRLIWVGSLICSVTLPALAFGLAEPVETTLTSVDVDASAAAPVQARETTATAAALSLAPTAEPRWWTRPWGASLSPLDLPLTAIWIALSVVLALNFLGGVSALALMRRRWERRKVLGTEVFVSEMTGPALVGVVSPMIVLPSWVLKLHPGPLSLMLEHEKEHRRAGDGRLLTLAEIALVAMPWNLALWWQVLRLRVAVELDCDARVLRHADARSYGDLLLEMARLGRGPRLLGSAAFAERAVHLERRIRLLARRPQYARRAPAAAACIGLAALSLAWMAPRPVLEAAAESLEELPLDGAPVLSSPTYQTNVCAFASADGVAAPLVDSAFARLFTGIALTRAQQSDACGVLIDLERQQRAANESAREELRRNAVPAGAVITRRNDALRALLGDEAARALLAARTSPGPRSAGSAPASGARSGAANPEVQGRIGGAPQSAPANTSASVAEQSGAAIFERLFEGIALTREQAESTRAIIIRAEEELAPFRPVAPAILRFTRGTRIVSIRAPAGAELSALLSSDADRALLESRMSVAPR